MEGGVRVKDNPGSIKSGVLSFIVKSLFSLNCHHDAWKHYLDLFLISSSNAKNAVKIICHSVECVVSPLRSF